MSETRLILHVKGTEGQTAELPKQIVRAGIAQGEITRSQLIWSAAHNAWKQVRELPHLLPSQKMAPAPAPRVPTVPLPEVAGQGQTGPVPRVAIKAGAAAGVRVAKATAGTGAPVARAAMPRQAPSTAHHVIKDENEFHPMKWLSIGMAVLILLTVVINYFLVQLPLASNMVQTPYSKISVYGHLGAFVQPKAMVVHVPSSAVVTESDLIDFLQAVAHSTPDAPMSDAPFDYVSVTTGWTGHYSFSGFAWKEFGDMKNDDEAQKKAFLLDQVRDSSGQSLVTPKGTLDPGAEQTERDTVWSQFSAYFTKS